MKWPVSEFQALSDIVLIQTEDRCLIIKDDVEKKIELSEVSDNTEIISQSPTKFKLTLLGSVLYGKIYSYRPISKRNKLNM